jgi:glycerol kinase
VERPATTESTELGAAYLAGLAMGFWRDQVELAAHLQLGRRFESSMDVSRREELYAGWERAVERAKGWVK